jgi:hypothetical protein
MSQENPALSPEEIRKQILASIKKQYSGEQTSRWLANLNDLPTSLNPDQSLPLEEAKLPVHLLADKIFVDFQRYAFEFNKNPVGTDLMVQCAPPTALSGSALISHRRKDAPISQGHISTRFFAMVLQLYEQRIRAFVIPADQLVGFLHSNAIWKSFLDLEGSQEEGGMVWKAKGEVITEKSLPLLSKRLFSALIKVATGDGTHNDPFQEKGRGGLLGEQHAPPAHYQESDATIEQRTGIVAETDSSSSISSGAKHQVKYQSASRSPQKGAARVSPSPAKKGRDSTALLGVNSDSAEVNAAFIFLLQALDEELNHLTKVGIHYLQKQDFETMQKLITRTTALKSARDQVEVIAANFLGDSI